MAQQSNRSREAARTALALGNHGCSAHPQPPSTLTLGMDRAVDLCVAVALTALPTSQLTVAAGQSGWKWLSPTPPYLLSQTLWRPRPSYLIHLLSYKLRQLLGHALRRLCANSLAVGLATWSGLALGPRVVLQQNLLLVLLATLLI